MDSGAFSPDPEQLQTPKMTSEHKTGERKGRKGASEAYLNPAPAFEVQNLGEILPAGRENHRRQRGFRHLRRRRHLHTRVSQGG